MRKGEATRQRIIEQAAPIFNQRGFAGCSIQDLMEATGLEKGGIYRHFATKEELAAEAFRYALAKNVKMRTEHLADIPNALDKLRRMVEIFVEVPSAMVGGCPLMNTAIDADDTNPALRKLALQGIKDWKSRIVRVVEEGKRRGEISRETTPMRVANTMVATLEGAQMISRLEGTKSALRDAQASLQLVISAIEA